MMNMRKLCWSLLLLSLVGAPACSGSGGSSTADGGDGSDGATCQGAGQRLLAVLGSPRLDTVPGGSLELKVVLSERCLGAVAGETVGFAILGEAGGATLAADSAVTSDAGIAMVELQAGDREASFSVRATHPDDPDGVYFSITVAAPRLQIYPEGPIDFSVYTGEQVRLAARVAELETGRPVRQEEVGFEIVPPPPGDASLNPPVVTTSLMGRAESTFSAGTVETTYQVTARGAERELGTVTFTVQVRQRRACQQDDDCPSGSLCVAGACHQSGAGECASDDDCPAGYQCQAGRCRPEGSLPGSCEQAADCPPGYYCEGHQCFPCEETSDLPECGGGLACQDDLDCPAGFFCDNGVCRRACTPLDCDALGAECGFTDDGCGRTIDCGRCDAPDTCGGGGVANQCGCTPDCQGRQCGPDGCGGDCGDCAGGQVCNEAIGQCEAECIPRDCWDQGKDCGVISDGCGGSDDCGECDWPDTCGGGGVANVCGCTIQCQGRECGDDGCDGSCGECPPYTACDADGRCQYLVPDLAGPWYVEHYFNVREALPEFLQDLAGPMDLLDRWINECDFTGIGFIDDFLCDLVGEFVPDWVGDVVHILNSMYWILSEMRAHGELRLAHLNPPELVSGVEEWYLVQVRYPDACCYGDPGVCHPHQDPDFPECANIDISRGEFEFGQVGLEVEPFTARIVITPGNPPAFELRVDERRVRIEYSKFVGLVIDLLIDIFTGYDSLGEAISDIIDCQEVQDLIDDTFGDLAPDIRQQCENLKPAIVDGIYALLDQIGVGWKLMRFTGRASITVEDDDPPWGSYLGGADHESSGDGSWQGSFNILFEGPLSGSWYAER